MERMVRGDGERGVSDKERRWREEMDGGVSDGDRSE